MAALWAQLPSPTLPFDLSTLTPYAFSPRVTIYFCTTCGTTMFWTGKDGSWVDVGALEEVKGKVEVTRHIFIGDTKDGGISEWVLKVKGVELKRWMRELEEKQEEVEVGWKGEVEKGGAEEEPVKAWCHCKGVEFRVTKPNEESKDLKLGYPDGTDPWWLNSTHTRFRAGSCVCDSCRLAAGQDLMSWGFIPDCNLQLPDGSPLVLPSTFGTLKQYQSSADVLRYFCGTCGATVFWRSEGRPRLLDVACGLLDAKEGARAEETLWWDVRGVSNREDGEKRGLLVEDVREGMRAWKER